MILKIVFCSVQVCTLFFDILPELKSSVPICTLVVKNLKVLKKNNKVLMLIISKLSSDHLTKHL